MTDSPDFPDARQLLDFNGAYAGTPAWEIGGPQPALVELFDAGEVTGPVLDVGCGTGEHALLAAARGLAATGVDASSAAIALARAKAIQRGLDRVRFEVGDARDLAFLDTRFETVVDSGVLHVFLTDANRERYVASIRRALVPGGRYHLLVFSDAQPGNWGPRRMSRADLEAAFATGWELRDVEAAIFELSIGGMSARAWRATAVRTD